MPLCLLQNLHDLNWNRTLTAAGACRRLTSWTMTRPEACV
jgi:hypothetical protein